MLHEVIVFRVTVRADSAVPELDFPLEKNTETERETAENTAGKRSNTETLHSNHSLQTKQYRL